MDVKAKIGAASKDPYSLEELYQEAVLQDQISAFKNAVLTCFEGAPDNLLYAAWYYRVQGIVGDPPRKEKGVNWVTAVPISLLTGLIFWELSDFQNSVVDDLLPQLLLWWSPIATMGALIFLAVTSRHKLGTALVLGLGLLATTAYAILLGPSLDPDWASEQYLILAAIHLPLLSWIALGVSTLGFHAKPEERFAFLKKSIEVMVVAGLYLIAGVIFGAITIGMFQALDVMLPELWLRLIGAGGFGLLPVLAVATVYDPNEQASEQDFDHGLSGFISTMMRLLLPPTLAVLIIYIVVIPFNFKEPFENRDLLIVYNLMLFATMGLLLGATPIKASDLSGRDQKWLRFSIIAVAILVILISIYALAAIVYRTSEGGLTLNRLIIMGWNLINIGILLWLIYSQLKAVRRNWIASLQAVFSAATNAYSIWALILLILIPILVIVI